jgi:ZIP family zinc transporter
MNILSNSGLLTAFGASFFAGLATGVGALPILFIKTIPQKLQDQMMGFGAGVMLAASCFSLLNPALEIGEGLYGSGTLSVLVAAAGIAAGAIAFENFVMSTSLTNTFIKGHEGRDEYHLKRILAFYHCNHSS